MYKATTQMNKLITALVLTLLFLSASKDKQSDPKVVVEQTENKTNSTKDSTEQSIKKILCFGNSLTAGYGLDEQYAWPSLLQQRIDSLNYDFQVINAGLSGETTSGGLKRIDWVLREPIDIFILELDGLIVLSVAVGWGTNLHNGYWARGRRLE